MKKIITIMIAAFGLCATVAAQCTVLDLAVQLHSVVINGGQCNANFTLSWQQEVNSGNKFAVLHLWRTDQYPALQANSLAYTHSSDHPDETDLQQALVTIIIEDNGTANPFIGSSYYPHPAVPVLSEGITIDKEVIDANWERMTIKNLTITIPNCSGTSLTGDIWASQANHGQSVHCVSSGISLIIGNPRVSGNLNCIVPHQYDLSVKNEAAVSLDVTYNIFIDEGDSVYEPVSHDLKITTIPQGPFTILSGATYYSGWQSYLPYSNTKPYADHGLWVEVTVAGYPNKSIYYIKNICFALAVNYTAFTATRNHQEVKLLWQTSAEVNNYGFEVQRRTGNADFETIAFVPSKAVDGNNATNLSYSFIDLYSTKFITEYRIKQIDRDAGFKLSKVVAVDGEGMDARHVIYPNPAVSNSIKLLFKEWNTFYDVDLIDASGRVIKKYENINGQRLEINNVPQGIYTLRIFDRTTREIAAERVMVY